MLGNPWMSQNLLRFGYEIAEGLGLRICGLRVVCIRRRAEVLCAWLQRSLQVRRESLPLTHWQENHHLDEAAKILFGCPSPLCPNPST